jgi:hypothetical protein
MGFLRPWDGGRVCWAGFYAEWTAKKTRTKSQQENLRPPPRVQFYEGSRALPRACSGETPQADSNPGKPGEINDNEKGENMRKKGIFGLFIVAVAVGLTFALVAQAATVEKNMELRQKAMVGGKELEPKTYRFKITDDGKMTVKLGKNLVAEADGEWVETNTKAVGDTFIVENGVLREVRIEGRSRVWRAK